MSDLRSASRSVREKPELPPDEPEAPLRHHRRSKGARLRELTDRLRHNSVDEPDPPPPLVLQPPLPLPLLLPPTPANLLADAANDSAAATTETLTECSSLLQLQNLDSLSEGEADSSSSVSYFSRRYNKRPLRGPYGQILEAEMKRVSPAASKVMDSDLGFLQSPSETAQAASPPCQTITAFELGASSSSVASSSVISNLEGHVHQRAASSPCQMVGLEEQVNVRDTRTHVVYELYETEKYYVDALRTLVMSYMVPLKESENLIESHIVDEIFFQIPSILHYHEILLEDLQKKLDNWDWRQRIGDTFLDFSQKQVVECYTEFINNWQRAKSLVKSACQTKPAFSNFLEAVSREHRGKLTFDALLIMPVQRIPRYELLIQALLKHTSSSHPDYSYLVSAQRAIHALAVTINCKGRASCTEDNESKLSVKEVESFLDGCDIFPAPDRTFIRHDLVTVKVGESAKERMVFLFSDLMVIAGVKKRGPVRKTSSNSLTSTSSILEYNKFKTLMKIPLSDVDFAKAQDESVKLLMHEITEIKEDSDTVSRIIDLASRLHCSSPRLEEVLHEMQINLSKKLFDKQLEENGFHCLTINVASQLETLTLMFDTPEQRETWESAVTEAKQKLDQKFSPQFLYPVTIRKTRSGLQFTCAAATAEPIHNERDIWICNSDGYVGQICILQLGEEPKILSTNEICESRILCITAATAYSESSVVTFDDHFEGYHDLSDSNFGENFADMHESTMWLGTEDGNILVYSSKNVWQCKMKTNHGFTVYSILYLDNRIYASLANGSIVIYSRNSSTGWDLSDPLFITVSSPNVPVTKMVQVGNGAFIWCACHNLICILNTKMLLVENTLCLGFKNDKSINCISCAGNTVWISLQNSSIVRLYNGLSLELLCEINVAQNVTAMLKTGCDDIIRQHKAACLRVTALVAHQDFLWVGTSAGVILKIRTPPVNSSTKLSKAPCVKGISRGHTGHVRFLTTVEMEYAPDKSSHGTMKRAVLVISGGDGYEDFRCSNVSELAGREDSTNHLLVWRL
ncbi:rho guanine nucleotide exchange factor 17-like isoform X3 [Cloeon dipterum]|uniref:rho guanine nucleotide exchange factor 17-like isoform X3 n=1 Tax=Cloeon dipterum TaxID=197152 RepID=UPI00321FDE3A